MEVTYGCNGIGDMGPILEPLKDLAFGQVFRVIELGLRAEFVAVVVSVRVLVIGKRLFPHIVDLFLLEFSVCGHAVVDTGMPRTWLHIVGHYSDPLPKPVFGSTMAVTAVN